MDRFATAQSEIMNKMPELTKAIRECGVIITDAKRSDDMVDAKAGHANFVTTFDRLVQEELRKKLLEIIPDAAFAGEEEDGEFCIPKQGFVFVVDPIDGTTNFIYDYHVSCISVGIVYDGERFAGLVYNPYLDEMYTAVRGKGAYLNNQPIKVYEGELEKSLTLFGTSPYNVELGRKSFEMAYKLFTYCADVRRSGSAAIDMCNVAAGRASLYFEMILSPWDFAAASLIIEEAGGIVTDLEGRELIIDRKCSALARSACMEDKVREIFEL